MIGPRRVRRRGARARRRAPPRHPIRVPSHVTERVMLFGRRSGVHAAKMCARPLQLHFLIKEWCTGLPKYYWGRRRSA